jgi:hypothetical protein
MKNTAELSKFLVWLSEPAERTGQIIVEALDEDDAVAVALNSLFAAEWDEQEVDAVSATDVCKLDPDGNVDKQRIYELARERGYKV